MSSVNKVIIVGNLGADPETRQFGNGGSVTHLAVATSERWTDKNSGDRREATEWHRISLFNKLGEVAAKYLRKGSKVYIEGSLRTNKYQDKSGQDRYSTEIRASEMVMLDSLGSKDNPSHNPNQPPNNQDRQQTYGNTGQQGNSGQQGYGSQGNQNNAGNFGQNNYPQGNNSYNNQSPVAPPNQFKSPVPSQPQSTAMPPNAPSDDDIPF